MRRSPIQLRYGDLMVLEVYRHNNIRWVRARCVREVDGKPCGRERKIEAKRLRQANACERCSDDARGRRQQALSSYPNGQPVVTPGNYRERWKRLEAAQRLEVSRMIAQRRLAKDEEWEAVEAVVQSIGVEAKRDARPPLHERVDYRGNYGG